MLTRLYLAERYLLPRKRGPPLIRPQSPDTSQDCLSACQNVGGPTHIPHIPLAYAFRALETGLWLQVIAQYNYAGNSTEDLPFKKDELLRIIAKTKARLFPKACPIWEES